MRNSIAVFAAVVFWSLLYPIAAVAYDGPTHAALTDQIVDFYNLNLPSGQAPISPQQKEWVVQGSLDEDTPPRWINHFFDPIYNRAWNGERTGVVPAFLVRLVRTFFLSIDEPLTSIEWVNSYLIQESYVRYGGNHTWKRGLEHAADGNQEEAYKTLGHVLHLLEDLTVPEHTRNDPHAHDLQRITGDYGSPYEEYTKRWTRRTIGAMGLPQHLYEEAMLPLKKADHDDYLITTARYTNSHYFSKDSINDPEYQLPKIEKEEGGWAYDRDESGEYFPIAKVVVKIGSKGDLVKTYSLENDPDHVLVLDAYFLRLARQAVVNGAGLVELFRRQVGDAIVNKEFPEHLVEVDLKKLTVPEVSFYGEAIRVANVLEQFKQKSIFSPTVSAFETTTPSVTLPPLSAGGVSASPTPSLLITSTTIPEASSSEIVLINDTAPSTTATSSPAFIFDSLSFYKDPRPSADRYLVDVTMGSTSLLTASTRSSPWYVLMFYLNQAPSQQELISTEDGLIPVGANLLGLYYGKCDGGTGLSSVLIIPSAAEFCQTAGPLGGAFAFSQLEDQRLIVSSAAQISEISFSENDYVTLGLYAFDHAGGGRHMFKLLATDASPHHFQDGPIATTAPLLSPSITATFDLLRLQLSLAWLPATDVDTLDSGLLYEVAVSSSTIKDADWRAVGRDRSFIVPVTFPGIYAAAVRAIDDFGNVSTPAVISWTFPDDFAPLPMQLFHDSEIGALGEGQKVRANQTMRIDAVSMWVAAEGGPYCCAESVLELHADDDGAPGELLAVSDPGGIRNVDSPGELRYPLPVPTILEKDRSYWLIPVYHRLNGTRIYGTTFDVYPDGSWRSAPGADAYFLVHTVP